MPATFKRIEITPEFLNSTPDAYFVFGDNLQKIGLGGAAKLRGHPKAIGFVTKKAPSNELNASFKPEEYASLFFDQLKQLEAHIKNNPKHTFYVSKLGSGLANRYYIWQKIIGHNLTDALGEYDNVVFCWDETEDDFK
jgi:hypothetical protein